MSTGGDERGERRAPSGSRDEPTIVDPTDRDQQLLAIHQFVDLVIASTRSPRQRRRLQRAAGLPVTEAGSSLLRSVSRHGPLTLSELAGRVGLDQSTVSRQIQPLVSNGLVDRAPDPADGRSTLISLSTEGERLLARVRNVARHDYDSALADWTDDERATFAAMIDRFRRALVAAEVDDRGWSRPRQPSA